MKFKLGDIVYISDTCVKGIITGIDINGEDYWVGFNKPLPDNSDFKDYHFALNDKAAFDQKVYIYKHCFPLKWLKFDRLKPFLGFGIWLNGKNLKKFTIGKDNVQTTTKS